MLALGSTGQMVRKAKWLLHWKPGNMLEPTDKLRAHRDRLELVLVLVPSDHGDGDVLPQPRPSPGS